MHTHPMEGHSIPIPIPRGMGVFKIKSLEAKYEAELEFLGGWEVQNKQAFCGGRMDVFLNCTPPQINVKLLKIQSTLNFVGKHGNNI